MKIKVKTLVEVRLDGKTEPAGKVVEINDWLLKDWLRLGLATENLGEDDSLDISSQTKLKQKTKGKKAALKAVE